LFHMFLSLLQNKLYFYFKGPHSKTNSIESSSKEVIRD
jgi:hypothetical protein